jgi:hypothetical protein
MPKAQVIPVEQIEKAILLVRGQKVMLDRDLAELYGVQGSEPGGNTQWQPVPSGLHVPTNRRRSRISKVTICDLKGRARSTPQVLIA